MRARAMRQCDVWIVNEPIRSVCNYSLSGTLRNVMPTGMYRNNLLQINNVNMLTI